MRNCIVKVLLLFSMLYLASCELSSFDDENKNKEEQTEGENTEGSEENEEEQNPEELPEFCDVHTIEGWTNVRFCKNGIVIFTKNFDGTQSVNKALMFVPSEECGITSIYGEYDESGMPKYLSFDDAVVFVEDYKDGLVDLSLVQGEECMWAAEDLELDAREAVAVSTRAWQDNNWVRNTCAIGGLVTSAIGVGAGVAVSSSGVGLVGGLLMIGASSKALVDNLDKLFGTGGDFVFSEYAIGKIQGICMETMVDVLTDNKESYLKTLWPDKFNFKNGLPDTPNTFWVDLTLGVVDAKWGKTVTEADKRRAFIIAHLGYKIVTGRADDIKQSSATLYGYISPEALSPLGKFADVEYGIVLYPTEDENARMHESYYSAEGGLFSISFYRLESDTEYSYFTYYYDKTNSAYRQGEVNTFKTKGEDSDLREHLVQFYYDTGGDNWDSNYNWCTDAPLNEWYGVHFDEQGNCELILTGNNLVGQGSLSGCTSLVYLDVLVNQLTSLDVSGCTSLEALYCSENQLTSLDVSGCTSLEALSCPYNQITSLNVSDCTSLVGLHCEDNQLTSLNVSGCTSLGYLYCRENQLTSLDLSGFTSLVDLNCDNNQLTRLDVSGCTSLEALDCHNIQLISLDASDCSLLLSLSCVGFQLTSLDMSGCTSLVGLHCDNNQLTSLDVSGCTSLERLECYNNQLTSLDVSDCTLLRELRCFRNQLTSLNVSGCTSLAGLYLNCSDNQLTSLDVSGCTSLVGLNCDNNQLTSLNVSGCTSLEGLSCENNQLTSLDLSGFTSLVGLDCDNNQLTRLDVSGCTSLEELDCYNIQLTSLDASGCTSLLWLYCAGLQLTSLDVSDCTSLEELYCRENQLTSLDVSGCTSLERLECGNNQLTSLEVTSCSSLKILRCWGNQIKQVITDFYDQLEEFQYDVRYVDYYRDGDDISHYTDNGVGWWYPGEPGKGYHGK